MAGVINNMPGARGSRVVGKRRLPYANPQMTLPGMERPGPLPSMVRDIPKVKAKGMPARLQSKAVRMSNGRTIAPKMSMDYIMGGTNKVGKQLTETGAKAGGGIMRRLSNMSGRSKIGISLGLGVAAAVTMNRRGEGASSGRQSIYRY